MSGSRPKPAEGHLAEQHLGDRLAALVDGELGHDARERVLAHVATCPKCKAEVDAQRRLKNVFAEAAPPPLSESFLARLQGLPAGGDLDGGGTPFGGGGLTGGLPGRPGAGGVFGMRRGGERFEFDYVPAGPHTSVLPAAGQRGFRIHDVGRADSERASRGRRFAFVAAGAVSLAAIALGGVTIGAPGDPEARGGSGSNVTPMRSPGTGTPSTPENQRRRAVGPLLAQVQGGRMLGETPAAPTQVSAPLLPGVTGPHHDSQNALTTPVVAGAAAMSPLIRPLTETPPISLTAWSMAPEVVAPGLVTTSATPHPTGTPTPATPRTAR
ncbi:zf-HC2 domain-containing protein [Streptomyces sp. NPDC001595]|uniref:zf-HC2 domain-containing protein n=1 Tax=Streptomyces sp. NPDC001532 TaxID=3154520 RepID=UPI003334047C